MKELLMKLFFVKTSRGWDVTTLGGLTGFLVVSTTGMWVIKYLMGG